MPKRIQLFPTSTTIQQNALTIAGNDVASLVKAHGTPLYLYDRATMDQAAAAYKSALAALYPAPASVTYAAKAFLCTAIAQWIQEIELWTDCTGEGEITIARAGGVPPEHILVHGVNKSSADLNCAVRNAGTIVVDNIAELKRIRVVLNETTFSERTLSIWLRLLPGLAVQTHHVHTQTGQHDSKFGMTHAEILEAASFCKENAMPVQGIHFHQGSNFRDATPLKAAIDLGLDLAREIGLDSDWHFSPGGGWGVAYHEDELPQPDIDEYVRVIAKGVIEGCQARGLALPHLHLEPGRSLVARAGVAVYQVGAIKRRGDKVWILTDGGMTDNPRFAMYAARYSCLPVAGVDRAGIEKVSIAGPYCESGDLVIEDLLMPKLEEGELIAIPVSGAYHLSMSSNYNGSRRPCVLWLADGRASVIMRRETSDDLLRRDACL